MDKGEYRAALHSLVEERRQAGQPVWAKTIRLGTVWKNPDLTFEQRRDAIVRRLRASGWLEHSDFDDELGAVIDELAGSADPDAFDSTWNDLYILADWDRVWIDLDEPNR